jgi:N-acetylneuraminate synthase
MNKQCFIIAEIGINHNGSVDTAKKLILAAKYAGANAVKFQKRTIDKVYTKEELDKYRESPWGTTNRQQKLGLELSKDNYDEINILCRDIKIDWFASPWDLDSVKFLEQYPLKYSKIPSALLVYDELLRAVARQHRYTFISTGMSTFEEIDNAIEIFEQEHCWYELMHCNSQYPVADENTNLRVIITLRDRYKNKPCCQGIGYSCHNTGITPAISAVAFGATSIEKHITLDRAMYGTDQAASVEPSGFYRLVDYIRCAERCFGDGIKKITIEEEKIKSKLRRTRDL